MLQHVADAREESYRSAEETVYNNRDKYICSELTG